MSYSTYLGANIIPMPTTPGFKDCTLTMNDSVGQTQSPFSIQQQEQYWAGGDFWTLEFTLPPMTDQEARPWMAWIASLRGRLNCFPFFDPNYEGPYGAVTPTPEFAAAAVPGQYSISIGNLTPSTNNIFMPGDILGLYPSMHIVAGVGPYNSNSSGDCTVEIWPSLRNTFGVGNGIGLNSTDATGLFRLMSNDRPWTVDAETRLWTLSVKAIEVR